MFRRRRECARTIHAGVLDPLSAYDTGFRARVSRGMTTGVARGRL